MKPHDAVGVTADLATLMGVPATAGLVDAARRLFDGQCFTISDLNQVGHPVVYASAAFARLTGYHPDQVVGRDLGFLQRDDNDQDGLELVRTALLEGRACSCVLRNYRSDGGLFWNEQRFLPIGDARGRPSHLLVFQREVTDSVHAAEAESVRRTAAERAGGKGASFAYALLLDDAGRARWSWASAACRPLTGFTAAEVATRGLLELVVEEDRAAFQVGLDALYANGERQQEYRLRTRDGRSVWVEDFAVVRWPVGVAEVKVAYGVVRDVSDRRVATPGLWRGAHFDALTGLPNRHLLEDRVRQALHRTRREGGATVLALIDLDDFHFVNETLGGERGDRVLQEVAARLSRQLRRSDTLARLDADTFAVLLTRLPQARSALPVLDKIQAAISDPLRDGGTTLRLSATIGVDLYPDGAGDDVELMAHAGVALEHAKERGRGGYRFYRADFDDAMRARARLEQELGRAVLEDQLVLHYQPRVELHTGAITSVEALVRWVHPSRGLLKPDQFVPLAEEARLGGALFDWVLERACAQAKRWQRQRTARRVAVNVSPQALADDGFALRVQEVLSRYDLHPGLLEIEINERTGAAMLEGASDRLRDLRGMGVHVALDDFGVAYTSLARLRGMPLDGIQIDRSFVERLKGRDVGEDVELLRAIIALGKGLRLTVTAEGIETREQSTLLRTLACDEGQGFLFSQAVPAEYVPAFA